MLSKYSPKEGGLHTAKPQSNIGYDYCKICRWETTAWLDCFCPSHWRDHAFSFAISRYKLTPCLCTKKAAHHYPFPESWSFSTLWFPLPKPLPFPFSFLHLARGFSWSCLPELWLDTYQVQQNSYKLWKINIDSQPGLSPLQQVRIETAPVPNHRAGQHHCRHQRTPLWWCSGASSWTTGARGVTKLIFFDFLFGFPTTIGVAMWV